MKKAIELLIICTALTVGLAGCMADTSLEDAAPAENVPESKPSADSSAEEQVHQLFESSRVEEEKYFNAILDALPGIDWSEYSNKYGIVGDNATGALELLEWLSHNPMTMQGDNMHKIFQATKGLDGSLSEQYSIIVGNFLRQDRDKFVELLGRLDRQSIERICRFTAYNCYYAEDMEQLVESTTVHFADNELSDSERFVVDSLIEAFERYTEQHSP